MKKYERCKRGHVRWEMYFYCPYCVDRFECHNIEKEE